MKNMGIVTNLLSGIMTECIYYNLFCVFCEAEYHRIPVALIKYLLPEHCPIITNRADSSCP
jgi:hypothetical protein